jgi:hypothetical protein
MPIRALIAALLAALTLSFAVASCGGSAPSSAKPVSPNAPEAPAAGDIPDNQAYVAYSPPRAGFAVKVPEGWSRTAKGATVTFTDKLNSITMESRPAPADPKGAETARVKQEFKGVTGVTVSTVKRKAGPATRIAFQAQGTPDAVTGKTPAMAVERYVWVHKGKEIVLTLSGGKGADNVDPWRIVTDSLRFTA